MGIPNYKDIIELIKTGATIEAQERIMELRQAALELQEENIRLRNEVAGLNSRVKELEQVDGEPCPRCRKRTWIVESSQPDPIFGRLGGSQRKYRCTDCGFSETALNALK